MLTAIELLEALPSVTPERQLLIMNVCGGHERAISQSGLRALLDKNIELIPGPGCPVCICPEEDIALAIDLAIQEEVVLLSFGDMLRVPIYRNDDKPNSLLAAKALGADVIPIASPLDALKHALENPLKEVVFFAVGFETTMAPVAALLSEDLPDNFSILLSGRLTWPAVSHLLEADDKPFDALIAPGHVASIMGSHEWHFVVEKHRLPAAIAGFHVESLLLALRAILQQYTAGEPTLENCYREVVKSNGNPHAQALITDAMDVYDANWRGIGCISNSGLSLKQDLDSINARKRFSLLTPPSSYQEGELSQDAACASVVMGRITPSDCPLYGNTCTPRSPFGPCMVSDEGACRIWWSSGVLTSGDVRKEIEVKDGHSV